MHVCLFCMCRCAYMYAVYVGVSVPIVCVGYITKVIFMYVNVSDIPEPATHVVQTRGQWWDAPFTTR